MEVDFHHAVTYLVARVAGFDHREADTISYCAQYVDDATGDGVIQFENGAMYQRCATAHKAFDYRSFAALAKGLVWIPFHFLPGNGNLPAGRDPEGEFVDKLITRPNSVVAKDMVRSAISEADKPWGLHRLGITAHVFVDTWAHQGFCGVTHRVNGVREVRRDGHIDTRFRAKVREFFKGWLHQRVPPLGHGAALSYPDRPYLRWSYINGRGEEVSRDNPADFLEAADQMYRVFKRWRLRNADAVVDGLPNRIRAAIADRFERWTGNGGERHGQWLKDLENDAFGIGPIKLSYIGKGKGSWKHKALGTVAANDTKDEVFPYDASFLTSDWKMFHDAAKAHRRAVVDDILPRYDICVA